MKFYFVICVYIIFLAITVSAQDGAHHSTKDIKYSSAANHVNPNSPAKSTQILETGTFYINDLYLPFDNVGVLADADAGNGAGMKFDSKIIAFSFGFFLSGISHDSLWANGTMTGMRIQDYISGRIGSGSEPIYTLANSLPVFGASWQNWKTAVQKGARFYDGDNDGIYNPVDKNSNDRWDPNEDRPDQLCDDTRWIVYNDGKPAGSRFFQNVVPQGIEVRQSLFGYKTHLAPKSQVFFVRFTILNTGTVANKLDSVYFSLAADADVGDYEDDLVACDTNRNAGYFYQINSDRLYGDAPPTLLMDLMQGPAAFIPGKTFTDVNNNGIFDALIDTPLDTARENLGEYIGRKVIPGAKNLPINSFTQIIYSNPIVGFPNTKQQLRNYQTRSLGLNGLPINPCTWGSGQMFGGVPCANVNPAFMYSGDPVAKKGWLNITTADQRLIVSTGPFSLDSGKSVDIIAAYMVGRGTNGTNSVQVAKQMDDELQKLYKNNFSLTSDIDRSDIITGKSFLLEQNHPNPFNPSTTIRYQLTASTKVTLTVHDALGRQVAELVNEIQGTGMHHVVFEADPSMSSGVYFYNLRTAEGSMTKKFILLK